MFRSLRSLLIGLSAFTVSCSGSSPDSQVDTPINQAQSAIQPEIVVQVGHRHWVSDVKWINGGRNLVSIDDEGRIVVWDVARRVIIDHAQVPLNDWMQFYRIEPQDDPEKLSLIYSVITAHEDLPISPDKICPPAASRKNSWCTFTLDLVTREVRPDAKIAIPAMQFDEIEQPLLDSEVFFPVSPNGKWRPESVRADLDRGIFIDSFAPQFSDATCTALDRCGYGIVLRPTSSSARPIRLIGSPRSYVRDIDLSSDGKRLVELENADFGRRSRARTVDLTTFSSSSDTTTNTPYDVVQWLEGERYALVSRGFNSQDENDQERPLGLAPARLIDPVCLRADRCPSTPGYYAMEPLDDLGNFIGAGDLTGCLVRLGLSLCDSGPHSETALGIKALDPMTDGISRYRADLGKWQRMEQPDWGEQQITAIRLSPAKDRLAVLTRESSSLQDGQVIRVWLFAIDGNRLVSKPTPLLARSIEDYGQITDPKQDNPEDVIHFTPNGDRIVFSHYMHRDLPQSANDYDLFVIEMSSSDKVRRIRGHSEHILPLDERRVFEFESGRITDIVTGKTLATVSSKPDLLRAGLIEGSDLIWGAGDDGTIRFWDPSEGSLQLTLYLFPENRFFAVTPGGRYDTNLGPDTGAIRWLVPDAPFQSLAPQTFMRDFFEPGLYGKLLDCRAKGTCGEVFRQLPAIASLNRVLPNVRITGVKPGKSATEAIVSVEVAEGENSSAVNGKTVSGIYNPRLFRDGRLVAMTQVRSNTDGSDIAVWRSDNGVGDKRHFQYTVPLPTSAGSESQIFTAYAFNEDRIKSETASFTYKRPPVAPRQPRAFVITIGIDDYETRRFRLNYAAADAKLLADRLARIPGYEMHRLTLAGEQSADRKRRRVDKATIENVLALLGGSGDRAALLQKLWQSGIDATALEAATPDDLVIVSFSGHGWADSKGNFYLLPANAAWSVSSEVPDYDTLLSSADLVRAFQRIIAADIALIIDACHSSASVDNGRFKAGPMGDSGLGQLAYDKGILILAATQANDVARENAALGQGLLTYALAGEGLTARGGEADLDGDSVIYLAEWLDYAVRRLPSLSQEVLGKHASTRAASGDIGFSDEADDVAPAPVQQPSLFDFTRRTNPVMLRRISR